MLLLWGVYGLLHRVNDHSVGHKQLSREMLALKTCFDSPYLLQYYFNPMSAADKNQFEYKQFLTD